MLRRALHMLEIAVVVLAIPSAAAASWHPGGSGRGYSQADTMPAGNTPSASVSGRNVTVSWTASTLSGGGAVDAYVVKRYNTSGQQQTIGANCSGTISGTTCAEKAVAPGSWKYSVTPAQGGWRGTESAQSSTVTVGSPTLTLDSPSVTSLPTTVTGQITNFIDGQTVSFRLDNPNTGRTLSGTISPSPVPSNGMASVSVTIPTGVPSGSHTVYAIGDQGDTASAAISVQVTYAPTTSAWTVSDLSSGTATDTSDPYAASGGPFDFQTGFQAAFDANRYLALDYTGPLRAGFSTSGVNFNFSYYGVDSSGTVAANTCFYFDVRRISNGNVLATHGSAANPVSCTTSLTPNQVTTSLPEVTNADIANDIAIRIYMTNAASGGFTIEDLATVTGSEGSNSFTLDRAQAINRASGTSTTLPWSLYASGDGAVYTTNGGWDTGFNTSKYVKLTFPAYAPSNATGISATFKDAYKPNTSGNATCYYIEVYNGSTMIGTHGSSSSPISCNSSSSFTTDTVSLPEVNSVASANNLVIRIYGKTAGPSSPQRKTQYDLATVTINYTG